ncbi:MAG: SufE family protein [Melioribacteraceae bacterium]|jgi:cysteine desulfuration protein SufE|nr:SufE family protein [Melioribacteraceae bacterium]
MTIKEIQNEIVTEFEEITEWDEKYALLIKFGRDLKEFPEEFRTDKIQIEGCQ